MLIIFSLIMYWMLAIYSESLTIPLDHHFALLLIQVGTIFVSGDVVDVGVGIVVGVGADIVVGIGDASLVCMVLHTFSDAS